MNYYFPYGTGSPFMNIPKASNGLFGKFFKNGINWSKILNGTQRTLNIINQTIPTIKQISPVVKNAKTMFKVMNEFKKADSPSPSINKDDIKNENVINEKSEKNTISYEEGPTFFA